MNRISLLRLPVLWPTEGGGLSFKREGLEPGASPEHWNLVHPDQVAEVARSYVDAGARIIITNTFGGNAFVLGRHGLGDHLEEINRRGAELSVQAAGDRAFVFGSMGPTGKLLQTGEVTEDEIFDSYSRQSEALWRAGLHAILIETMIDLDEMMIAARAARAATPLPLVLSMTFDSGKEKTQTMMGVTPERAVAAMEEAGAWMVGANCGLGPEYYVKVCRKMRSATPRRSGSRRTRASRRWSVPKWYICKGPKSLGSSHWACVKPGPMSLAAAAEPLPLAASGNFAACWRVSAECFYVSSRLGGIFSRNIHES